ncbi:MAG TPA: AI-2E family transporter [Methanolinea sp.]|jgi:predicted PurR-regulated permease PerM|nr:MAG: pheromone autoinducer 2 transporter [Methanoregulaceae archaeon PtaU1.Bin066]HII77200.1 AI-2E family transporter [Methanolinea sp.]
MLPEEWPSGSRALVLAGFFFLVIIGLKFCAYVVTIIVISLILTLIACPAMDRMRKKGIPDIASVTILTLVAIAAVLVLIGISLYSFGVLMHDLPLYQAELNQRMAQISGMLAGHGLPTGAIPPSPDLGSLVGLILSSVMNLSDLLLYLFFIGVATFFMMLEAPHLADRLTRLPGVPPEKMARLSRMSGYMIDFVVVRTETNLIHGILFGGSLYAMGVHAAMLWGVLTFVLAYIPFIGLIIAAIPAIFFAWLQFGLWGAAAVVAIVCILNLVVENPVFSYFAARKFEIPALIVILSVIFWGWLLGIAGMVFAVPLTLMVLITIQYSDDLAWVNTLLGVDRIFGESTENT